MKVLYYDCFSGISGDMNLGAMIDLGVDKNYLIKELKKLSINEKFEVEVKKDERKGISGTKVEVILRESHHENHHHRTFRDVEKIINDSSLEKSVKIMSLSIFRKLAEAEGKIHSKDLYEVHFHEVGAVDSIVDIVGAAICFQYLNVDRILCSPVQLGGGFVKCAHGLIPVPAPAVSELLKGVPVKIGAVPFETTTPTGAAILKTMVSKFTEEKEFIIDNIGYGVGNRDTEIPNLLRVYLGKVEKKERVYFKEECFILECNIDDMNPEMYEYVYQKLFLGGALDVFITSIIMKKGRPGVKLSVLCHKEKKEKLKKVLFRETSTLGIRECSMVRDILKRDFSVVKTSYGEIRVKKAYVDEKDFKVKPEYEDCKRAALENNVPIRKVLEEVYNSIK